MFKHAVIVLEESYMTEHIKLIIADDFVVIFFTENLEVVLRCSHCGYACTGESNL